MPTQTHFLETIKMQGHFEDDLQAKDAVEVVFRTMRDLMSTEATNRVTQELSNKLAVPAEKKAVPSQDRAMEVDIADLWQDTDPIESALSADRPPQKFDSDSFLYRVGQETSLPTGTSPKQLVQAVFSATKEELSSERVREVASFLPDQIQQMWEEA